MSNLTLKGKLTKKIHPETGVSKAGKQWKKQSFVIDTGDKYNPEVCFNLFGHDKVALLDGFSIGEGVNVCFNAQSREYNGKYYTNLEAWKIDSSNFADGNDAMDRAEDEDLGPIPF